MNCFIAESLAADYRVEVAFDGNAGLAKAEALQPDLILSDIMMPAMSGDALVAAIRSRPELDGTPIILLTAKADDALRVRLLREGAQDYLTKPMAVDELRARVANLVARKRALESRDDVLAAVAHDLRSPLSSVLLQASLLQQDGAGASPRKAGEAIERAAQRMGRLIDDLLDVARLEAGSLTLARTRLTADHLLADAVDAKRPLTAAADLDLRLDVHHGLPELWADRERLLQVLDNLIDNAIKFSPRGGRITIGAAERSSDVLFWVADVGSGIRAQDQPYLFDRFWQARVGGRRGAGLGLPIAKGIVEAHGGRMWVESKPGRGSTFFFGIPKAPQQSLHLGAP